MRNIYVNAPTQNKDFCPDEQFGKVMPMLASAWLAAGSVDAGSPFQLWNNVLASEQQGHTEESYRALAEARLAQKYNSATLNTLRDLSGEPQVMSDSDPDFTKWAQDKIKTALEAGDVKVRRLGIFACEGCEAALAPGEGPQPAGCRTCPPGTEVVAVNRQTMVSYFSPASMEAVRNAGVAVGADSENGRYFIVNKRRLAGIPIGHEGFTDEVIDPRIGLGLLAMYAAELRAADSVQMVASRSTLGHNLSHFFATTLSQLPDMPRLHMTGIVKAPAHYLTYLRDDGVFTQPSLVENTYRRLVPALFSMHKDMSPEVADRLLFSRRTRNIDILQIKL